jgi:hypothetical protein
MRIYLPSIEKLLEAVTKFVTKISYEISVILGHQRIVTKLNFPMCRI